MIRVLHFGLGQRRTAGDAPVHGLFAAIDKTLFNDIGKEPQLIGLIFFVEREVRIFPVAKHAKALELRTLMVDVLARVSLAFAADLRRGGVFAARFAQLLHHLEFNR